MRHRFLRLGASAMLALMAIAPGANASVRVPRPPLPSPMPAVVQMAPDDPMYDVAAGYWDGDRVHVADLHYRFGVAHELGHVFDEQFLDAGERQRFATLQAEIYDERGRLAGHDGTDQSPWWTLAVDPGSDIVTSSYGDLSELFADAYANCRLVRSRGSGHLWETAYGYEPTAKQHRRICAFTVRAAADSGSPVSADGWR